MPKGAGAVGGVPSSYTEDGTTDGLRDPEVHQSTTRHKGRADGHVHDIRREERQMQGKNLIKRIGMNKYQNVLKCSTKKKIIPTCELQLFFRAPDRI